MKCNLIVGLTIIYLIKGIASIYTVKLKPSYTEERRSKLLLNLKLLQINLQRPSFLDIRSVTLHQQVLSQKRLATYYGDIGIGRSDNNSTNVQYFRMLFDTGSCEFWIPSVECQTQRCLTHRRYTQTSSFHLYNNAEMSIQYLSGKVEGKMATETITIGDMVIPNQVIGIASQVEIPLLDEVIWDGILGLSFPNENLKRQAIKPVMDNLMHQNILTKKGEPNQFGYYLGNEFGAISFGGIKTAYKENPDEPFQWAPVVDNNYWTIQLKSVKKIYKSQSEELLKNNSDIIECQGDQCKTILDTGTYLIYGPQEQVQDFIQDLVIDSCDQKSGLPDILFTVQGQHGLIKLLLHPQDYVLQFRIDGQDDCVIGIGPDTEDSGWTLGQVFLKSFYSVFDRDSNQVGFSRVNRNVAMDNKQDQVNPVQPNDQDREALPQVNNKPRLIANRMRNVKNLNNNINSFNNQNNNNLNNNQNQNLSKPSSLFDSLENQEMDQSFIDSIIN